MGFGIAPAGRRDAQTAAVFGDRAPGNGDAFGGEQIGQMLVAICSASWFGSDELLQAL